MQDAIRELKFSASPTGKVLDDFGDVGKMLSDHSVELIQAIHTATLAKIKAGEVSVKDSLDILKQAQSTLRIYGVSVKEEKPELSDKPTMAELIAQLEAKAPTLVKKVTKDKGNSGKKPRRLVTDEDENTQKTLGPDSA